MCTDFGLLEDADYLTVAFLILDAFIFLTGIAYFIVDAIILSTLIPLTRYGGSPEYYSTLVPILIIPTAILMVIISALGCWGVVRESRVILLMFVVSMVFVYIFQLSLGSVAINQSSDPDGNAREKEIAYFAGLANRSFYTGGKKDTNLVKYLNTVQITFKCCGGLNASDFPDPFPLPSTCCKYRIADCDMKEKCRNCHKNGCGPLLNQYRRRTLTGLGVLSILLSFITLPGIVLGAILASWMDRTDDVY